MFILILLRWTTLIKFTDQWFHMRSELYFIWIDQTLTYICLFCCLCWQEGYGCSWSLTRGRHDQHLYDTPQWRHNSLHHQVSNFHSLLLFGAAESFSSDCENISSVWSDCDSVLQFLCHRDIAAAIDRKEKHCFDEMIYVVRKVLLHKRSYSSFIIMSV